jgi:superfamily I DNA/RNA helicase
MKTNSKRMENLPFYIEPTHNLAPWKMYKRDIPYRIYGGLSFIKVEIKDVLCYLRLVINPKDEEALIRVINYPARGIGDTSRKAYQAAAKPLQAFYFL